MNINDSFLGGNWIRGLHGTQCSRDAICDSHVEGDCEAKTRPIFTVGLQKYGGVLVPRIKRA